MAVEGVVQYVSYRKQVSAEYRAAAADALLLGAEHLLEYANRSVPFDEGDLEKSGQADVDREALQASVSYDTPYAVRMHEHPEYNFQQKGHASRGKWLELSTEEEGDATQEYMARYMRGRVGP